MINTQSPKWDWKRGKHSYEYEVDDRVITITFSDSDWVHVRSALTTPVKSKPGAFKRTSRQVREQGFNPIERRWSQPKTPLLPSERQRGQSEIDALMASA